MDPLNSYYLAQAVVNVGVVGIGTFVVWLGYRLFRDMPAQREGEAKIALPGGVSIWLSRVGPGIFFALFGSSMIAYTAKGSHFYENGTVTASDNRMFNGAPSRGAVSAAVPPLTRPAAVRLVRVLAGLANEIATSHDPTVRLDSAQSERVQVLKEARARLMLQVWDPAWGNSEEFVLWAVSGGDLSQPPPDAQEAAKIFNGGPS